LCECHHGIRTFFNKQEYIKNNISGQDDYFNYRPRLIRNFRGERISSEQFFNPEQEEIGPGDSSPINPEWFDFGIE
jgi:hypothetical protein